MPFVVLRYMNAVIFMSHTKFFYPRNYKQGNSKQISTSKIIRPLYESKLYVHYTNISTPTSPINCNLHFCHSIFWMNLF